MKLTELTIRSKFHWNYSIKQIEEWSDELMISTEYIDKNEVFKLSEDGKLVGYYSLIFLNEEDVKPRLGDAREFLRK